MCALRNLHAIINSNTALNYWVNKAGDQIPVESMDIRYINNIVTRNAERYLKGTMTGERKAMFEGVVKEWHRRFPHYGL